jgi:hypothetical protein
MRIILLALIVACCSGSRCVAEEAKPAPQKTPAEQDYIKVEIRGTLESKPNAFELIDTQAVHFAANVLGMGLAFEKNKDLAAAAQQLNGRKVIVRGYLQSWSPMTAARSPIVIHYVLVTEIEAVK